MPAEMTSKAKADSCAPDTPKRYGQLKSAHQWSCEPGRPSDPHTALDRTPGPAEPSGGQPDQAREGLQARDWLAACQPISHRREDPCWQSQLPPAWSACSTQHAKVSD